MINGKKILAVIPARGGSKGVLRKNVRMIAGKPLIAWSIEAAKQATFVDKVILSTDDAEIAEVAQVFDCDVPFMRKPELACDETSTNAVLIDALERMPGYDWVLLLQPTSPLRSAEDIDNAIRICFENQAPSCVSVTLAEESPYWMYELNDSDCMRPLLTHQSVERRQDLPPVYSLNGAIYLAKIEWFLEHKTFITHETIAYKMPRNRSVDLDTEQDFQLLKFILGDVPNE